jgi:8-oxo-dGTP pyrophosphatase MutT (NUDIX family)
MQKTLEGFEKDEVFVKNRLRPKDAATLVLVRRDHDAPRVLMGKRHGNMAFMANKYVFPGGRIDACDMRLKAGGELRVDVRKRLLREVSETRARALALAAIRETFEGSWPANVRTLYRAPEAHGRASLRMVWRRSLSNSTT